LRPPDDEPLLLDDDVRPLELDPLRPLLLRLLLLRLLPPLEVLRPEVLLPEVLLLDAPPVEPLLRLEPLRLEPLRLEPLFLEPLPLELPRLDEPERERACDPREPCSCASPLCCSSPPPSSPLDISFFATAPAAVVATPAATPTATFLGSDSPSSFWLSGSEGMFPPRTCVLAIPAKALSETGSGRFPCGQVGNTDDDRKDKDG
jgi:hypothetical protein